MISVATAAGYVVSEMVLNAANEKAHRTRLEVEKKIARKESIERECCYKQSVCEHLETYFKKAVSMIKTNPEKAKRIMIVIFYDI